MCDTYEKCSRLHVSDPEEQTAAASTRMMRAGPDYLYIVMRFAGCTERARSPVVFATHVDSLDQVRITYPPVTYADCVFYMPSSGCPGMALSAAKKPTR